MPGDKTLYESVKTNLGNEKTRCIGAIDIGTNSTHLLVASVATDLHTFSIDLAEKSSTRLGERDPDSGNLTAVAMERVFDALKRFKDLAFSHQVEDLIIVATSAVREAPNGREFVNRLQNELDLNVELVSGAEEARLIYLGVLSGMPFGDRPHLLVDIGGGSTEMVLADGRDAKALTSTRVGAVRLQRDFINNEPIPPERKEFLQTFIQGSLEPAATKIARRMKYGETPVMVATSGTAMAIGAIASEDANPSVLKLHGFKLTKDSLDKIISRLLVLNPEERKKLPSISDRRAEIIVPGALILQTIMEMMKVEEVVLSERALREGLVVDWMFRKGLLEDRFSLQGSIRQRTVLHQAQRFAVNSSRAQRVSSHALALYDDSRGVLHRDKGEGRDLLWAAAMLHACGQHINLSAYHKHSWYLIRHGELLGYSHSEHLMIAAIARYHRKSLPKKRHDAWQALGSKEQRKIVSEMALLLRLSVAVDRRPQPVVASIDVASEENKVTIKLIPEQSTQSLSLEQWSLSNCIPLVKSLTGVELKILLD
ncbi:Ppx/GppA phosphatase family protein [Prochlorococcus marinus]|uniref:Putative exopolyphosphatase n=1 Tax=Prochlorococcus marinus (strain MIT 9211) TaxID=93059 RepID=A9BE79_PROM4|nr:Ppx/GppA phosphatase family protein [Prochlorococcus marinus]ABX08389.1 putative exopolyphosphatase [Prochlorococcus marinus str. MIT 9211]